MDDGGDPIERVLFRVMDVLEEAEVPYFVTGALVRNAYGEPRSSQDIDVVVEGKHEGELRRDFEAQGFDVQGPREGRLGRRLVLRGDETPVDLWLAPKTQLHEAEFDRAVAREYRGRSVPLMHPGDFVLRKLVNYRRIRGDTADLEDAYQVLLYGWDEVDRNRLLERAAFYRVETDARELLETVREDRADLEGDTS